MFERFIVIFLALVGTAKRIPEILRKSFSEDNQASRPQGALDQTAQPNSEAPAPRPRTSRYSEVLHRVREEKAHRREAKRQASKKSVINHKELK